MRWLQVALFLAVLAPPAAADNLGKAKEIYRRGQTAFTTGNFADAAALFEEAFTESHRPALLWNVAAANRKLFELDHDVTHLRRARVVLDNCAELETKAEAKEEARRESRSLDAIIKAVEQAAAGATNPNPNNLSTSKEKSSGPTGDSGGQIGAHPDLIATLQATRTPVYKRWWLWTVLGVVVAGGAAVTLAFLLRSPSDATPPMTNSGSFQPMF